MANNADPEVLLKKLRKLESNRKCPNCGVESSTSLGFGNICVKYKTFVCDLCKTSHQAISHRVKSVSMSSWTMDEVKELSSKFYGGNQAALDTWLCNAPPVGGKYPGGTRPKPGDKIEVYKKFIVDCYEHEIFKGTPKPSPVSEGNTESAPKCIKIDQNHLRNSSITNFQPTNQNLIQFDAFSDSSIQAPVNLISSVNETSVNFSDFCSPQPLSSPILNDDFLSDFTTKSIPTAFDAFHSEAAVGCEPSGSSSSIDGFGDFSFAPMMTVNSHSGFPVVHSAPIFNDFEISTSSSTSTTSFQQQQQQPQSNYNGTSATPVTFTTTVFPPSTFGINHGDHSTITTTTIPLLPINNNIASTSNYSAGVATFPPSNISLSQNMYFATQTTGNAISNNTYPSLPLLSSSSSSTIMMKPPPTSIDYSFSLSQQQLPTTTPTKGDVFDFVGSALCAELISSSTTGSVNNNNNNDNSSSNNNNNFPQATKMSTTTTTLPLSYVHTTIGTGTGNTLNNLSTITSTYNIHNNNSNSNSNSNNIPTTTTTNGYQQTGMSNIPMTTTPPPAMLRNNMADLLPPPNMLYANNNTTMMVPNNNSYLAQRRW